MRFEYWKTEDGQWTWELKTAVSGVLARGSTYPTREACVSAVRLVKLAAGALAVEIGSATPFPATVESSPPTFHVQPV